MISSILEAVFTMVENILTAVGIDGAVYSIVSSVFDGVLKLF